MAGLPVASTVITSAVRSTAFAPNRPMISISWPRVSAVALTLTRTSSRRTALSSSSTILSTSISLLSCLVICSSTTSSTLTWRVIRDISGDSVGPTASDSML